MICSRRRRVFGHVLADFVGVPVQRIQAALMSRHIAAVIQRPNTDRRRLQARRAAVVFKFFKDRFMGHALIYWKQTQLVNGFLSNGRWKTTQVVLAA